MAKKETRWKPLGTLHVLLGDAFPDRRTDDHEVLDVAWLAKKLKMSEEGIYKWLRQNRLTIARARQIVALKECDRELDDFLPFIV